MVVADCDLREGLHAKRWFDAVGHYSREDVLTALVDRAVLDVQVARGADRVEEPAVVGDGDDRDGEAASARSSTSSVSKSRWLVGSSSSSRSASEATMAAIAARARWPGLRRSSGRRTASASRPKWASSVRARGLVDAGPRRGGGTTAAAGRWPAASCGRCGQQADAGGDLDLAGASAASVPSRRLSSVVLPAPLAPEIGDALAAVEREVDVVQHAGADAAQGRDAAAAVGGGVEPEAHGGPPRAGARPTSSTPSRARGGARAPSPSWRPSWRSASACRRPCREALRSLRRA